MLQFIISKPLFLNIFVFLIFSDCGLLVFLKTANLSSLYCIVRYCYGHICYQLTRLQQDSHIYTHIYTYLSSIYLPIYIYILYILYILYIYTHTYIYTHIYLSIYLYNSTSYTQVYKLPQSL